jgi:DNA-damage-inducible protein D
MTQPSDFDKIKQSISGVNWWSARELALVLEFKDWRVIQRGIKNVKTAFSHSGFEPAEHIKESNFNRKDKLGRERTVKDYLLRRYACFILVAQYSPDKLVVAAAQAYFGRREE